MSEEYKLTKTSLMDFCIYKKYTYSTLYRYIKTYRPDISLNTKNNGKGKNHTIAAKKKTSYIPDKQILSKWYHEDKKTYKEIGNILHRSAATICLIFKKIGIRGRNVSERVKLWMDEDHKEYFRQMANSGKIGVFRKDFGCHVNTNIEIAFSDWCVENKIEHKHQFQIENNTHRYDFLIENSKILVEVDGVYFHNREKQIKKWNRLWKIRLIEEKKL